jgi:thiol-disulfide isomerase/thioredoxin
VRRLFPAFVVLLVAWGANAPSPARGEDPPADGAGSDAPAPAPEAGAGTEPREGPAAALERIQGEVRALPAAERRGALVERLKAWLATVDPAGELARGEDGLALGRILLLAGEGARAIACFQAIAGDEGASVAVRDLAAQSEAGALASASGGDGHDDASARAATRRLLAWAASMEAPDRRRARGALRSTLSSLLEAQGELDEALAVRMQSVLDAPALASAAARSVTSILLRSGHALEGYPATRTAARALFAVLAAQQDLALAEARAGGEERAIAVAEAGARQLEGAARPFEMLGEPAAAWTREWGTVEAASPAAFAGKVVVLDFWATWCPWCIKSFPAIRDLLRDYADRGLVVVGVTASANAVFEHRLDLDDDLRARWDGSPPKAAARLGGPARDDGVPVLEEGPFREREKEVVERFVATHEMTWPVVMIGKAEPGERFALRGWPHAVVLDRAGRVRYFKSGALLRDRPEDVQRFRAVLEDLLAE